MWKQMINWIFGPPSSIDVKRHQPKETNRSLDNPPIEGVGPQGKPVELSPKEKATLAGEPYISVLSVEIDPKDINNGSFELD